MCSYVRVRRLWSFSQWVIAICFKLQITSHYKLQNVVFCHFQTCLWTNYVHFCITRFVWPWETLVLVFRVISVLGCKSQFPTFCGQIGCILKLHLWPPTKHYNRISATIEYFASLPNKFFEIRHFMENARKNCPIDSIFKRDRHWAKHIEKSIYVYDRFQNDIQYWEIHIMKYIATFNVFRQKSV